MLTILLASIALQFKRVAGFLAIIYPVLHLLYARLHPTTEKGKKSEPVHEIPTQKLSVWTFDNLLHVSGATGSTTTAGKSKLVSNDIKSQTTQALTNIVSIIDNALQNHPSLHQSSFASQFGFESSHEMPDPRSLIGKCHIQLADTQHSTFVEMQSAFQEFFANCSSGVPSFTIERGNGHVLPPGVFVEIDCVAKMPEQKLPTDSLSLLRAAQIRLSA